MRRYIFNNHLIKHQTKYALIKSSNLHSQTIKRPDDVRMGWGLSVLKEMIPRTITLLSSQSKIFELIAVSYCKRRENTDTKTPSKGKYMSDSWLEITIPLSDNEDLRQSLARADNKTIRCGKLFELIDAIAVDVSFRHCGNYPVIVTATVDGVKAITDNMNIHHDLKLQAYLTYVGTTSLEVNIDMISGPPGELYICDI